MSAKFRWHCISVWSILTCYDTDNSKYNMQEDKQCIITLTNWNIYIHIESVTTCIFIGLVFVDIDIWDD